jgi:hypothetical protein
MTIVMEPVVIHVHKPCGHRCRCNSAKGSCAVCARNRQLNLQKERGW